MVLEFLSATAATSKDTQKEENTVSHKIKKGETLYSIAKQYGVSAEAIAKANNIKNNHIEAGKILIIPKNTKSSATNKTAKVTKANQKPKVNNAPQKPNIFGNELVKQPKDLTNKETSEKALTQPTVTYSRASVHFVKAGDTFASIEKLYGLRKGELRSYSTNSEIKVLKPNMQVQLPERVQIRNINNKKDIAKALGISTNYIEYLESIEKKRNRLYDDGAGNATVGIGHHAFGSFEKKYYSGRNLSDKEVYQLLAKDLTLAKNAIIKSIGQQAYDKMSVNQKEALIDFVFNRGKDAFRSSDCANLRKALKDGNYEMAAINIYTPNTLKNEDTRLGVSKRRLFEMHHFCNGKASAKVLKRAQQLYNAGLNSPSGKIDSTLAGHNKEIMALFQGKIHIKNTT